MDNSHRSKQFEVERGFKTQPITYMEKQYQHNSAGDGVAYGLGIQKQIERTTMNNRRHSEHAFKEQGPFVQKNKKVAKIATSKVSGLSWHSKEQLQEMLN